MSPSLAMRKNGVRNPRRDSNSSTADSPSRSSNRAGSCAARVSSGRRPQYCSAKSGDGTAMHRRNAFIAARLLALHGALARTGRLETWAGPATLPGPSRQGNGSSVRCPGRQSRAAGSGAAVAPVATAAVGRATVAGAAIRAAIGAVVVRAAIGAVVVRTTVGAVVVRAAIGAVVVRTTVGAVVVRTAIGAVVTRTTVGAVVVRTAIGAVVTRTPVVTAGARARVVVLEAHERPLLD